MDKESKEKREFNPNQMEGRNAVLELIKSGRDVEKILIAKGNPEGTIRRIVAMAAERNIVVQQTAKQKLDFMSQTKNHQGIIAIASAHEYAEISDILQKAYEKKEKPFIIILDKITDPQNLGAIIRSADASGCHGIIIPKRNSAGLTAIVGKTSAGAVEYVPVARAVNITSVIKDLKKEGLWIMATDTEGKSFYSADFDMPLALVIGSEGEGVSRLIKENCDFTVSIPMFGKISSLNASVAAGVLMYEVVRKRKFREV